VSEFLWDSISVLGDETMNHTKGEASMDTLAPTGEGSERYVLRLFIAGMTSRAGRAIESVCAMCDKHLAGRYDLEVIDIYQQPGLAKGEQIIAAPTLIKKLPLPFRRIIGDMSNNERLLTGLDIVIKGA
jgi:circadian clock protein KaiB